VRSASIFAGHAEFAKEIDRPAIDHLPQLEEGPVAADQTQVGARNARAQEASPLVQSAAEHLIDNAQRSESPQIRLAQRPGPEWPGCR